MSSIPDVLIIGGGVIGLTTAYTLTRQGASVAVLDRGALGQEASWAGAGIIPPGNPDSHLLPYELLRAVSSARFPSLSAELLEATGIDNGFRICGGIEWFDEDYSELAKAWTAEGIPYEFVPSDGFELLEPALASSLAPAIFFPGMAQVRNPRHLKALIAWCADRVQLRARCPVVSFEHDQGRIQAVQTPMERIPASQFLITAGAWTGGVLPEGMPPLAIRPIRGQIVLFNAEGQSPRRILLKGKHYLVPREDGRVLVGSTEEDVGFDKGTTATAFDDLRTFALGLIPGLARASVERQWSGLRPGSPDGLPYLGRAAQWDNLYVAAGHFRAGIQLSPATALVMGELILGKKPSIPLEPFDLSRQAGGPYQTAFRS